MMILIIVVGILFFIYLGIQLGKRDALKNIKPQRNQAEPDDKKLLIGSIEVDVEPFLDFHFEYLKDEISPDFKIESFREYLPHLKEPDTIVLKEKSVEILITYPLTKQALFSAETLNEEGWTKKELVAEICKRYHQVYKEEQESTQIEITPHEKRESVLNRNQTDGKYGIWGHDLGDLILVGMSFERNAAHKITISLDVES